MLVVVVKVQPVARARAREPLGALLKAAHDVDVVGHDEGRLNVVASRHDVAPEHAGLGRAIGASFALGINHQQAAAVRMPADRVHHETGQKLDARFAIVRRCVKGLEQARVFDRGQVLKAIRALARVVLGFEHLDFDRGKAVRRVRKQGHELAACIGIAAAFNHNRTDVVPVAVRRQDVRHVRGRDAIRRQARREARRALHVIDALPFGLPAIAVTRLDHDDHLIAAQQKRTRRELDRVVVRGRRHVAPQVRRHDAPHRAAVQPEKAIAQGSHLPRSDNEMLRLVRHVEVMA